MNKLTQEERDEIRRRAQKMIDTFRKRGIKVPEQIEVLWPEVVDIVDAAKCALQEGLSCQEFAESLRDKFPDAERAYKCPVRDGLADYPLEK
jgi:hypothetical protein